ncbi:MAG: cell division protein SepF [Synechococcaceae cyanobacterium]
MHSDRPATTPALTPAVLDPAGGERRGSAPLRLQKAPLGIGGQVLVFTPRSVHDARRVIEAVRANHTVLVNSAWLEDSPGQRLIDFVCGGIAAICGQVHRIAEEVFLFAPASVRVQGACEADSTC